MDAALIEETSETIVFDSTKIEVHTNEYADELRAEINNIPGFHARIEPNEPRVVIRERLI
jgi:hypothetical protein